MFRSNNVIHFKTTKPFTQILATIESELEILGGPAVSPTGGILIESFRFNGFGYKTSISGRITERDGKVTVTIDYEAKPEFIGWAIAICLFPAGAAILILPYNAKNDIERKTEQALSEIKSILNER